MRMWRYILKKHSELFPYGAVVNVTVFLVAIEKMDTKLHRCSLCLVKGVEAKTALLSHLITHAALKRNLFTATCI